MLLKTGDNDVTMSSAPDSNVMPSQAGNLSHVSLSAASPPGKDTTSHGSIVQGSGVSPATLDNSAPSAGPSTSGPQDSLSKAAAPSQSAGVSASSTAGSPNVPVAQDTCAPAATSNTRESMYDWVLKTESGLKDSHRVLWPSSPGGPCSATLATGLDEQGAPMFEHTEEDWRKALASGSIEKYQQFLSERRLPPNDNPS